MYGLFSRLSKNGVLLLLSCMPKTVSPAAACPHCLHQLPPPAKLECSHTPCTYHVPAAHTTVLYVYTEPFSLERNTSNLIQGSCYPAYVSQKKHPRRMWPGPQSYFDHTPWLVPSSIYNLPSRLKPLPILQKGQPHQPLYPNRPPRSGSCITYCEPRSTRSNVVEHASLTIGQIDIIHTLRPYRCMHISRTLPASHFSHT
mmetsp:Transcript_872/g.1935  ORF Transcript_872/g.1935 Transcript_872/m.1935 type:complete len:200 (+) Transcript_872:211-810(+)